MTAGDKHTVSPLMRRPTGVPHKSYIVIAK